MLYCRKTSVKCVIHRFTNAYELCRSSVHGPDTEVVSVFEKDMLVQLPGIQRRHDV